MATLVLLDILVKLPATLARSVNVIVASASTLPLVALNVKVGVAFLIVKAFVAPVKV